MIPVALLPDDMCHCAYPHDSGRRYFRRSACTGCGKLIVGDVEEKRRLRRLEESALLTEKALGVPKAVPVEGVGEDFARMYPGLARRLG